MITGMFCGIFKRSWPEVRRKSCRGPYLPPVALKMFPTSGAPPDICHLPPPSGSIVFFFGCMLWSGSSHPRLSAVRAHSNLKTPAVRETSSFWGSFAMVSARLARLAASGSWFALDVDGAPWRYLWTHCSSGFCLALCGGDLIPEIVLGVRCSSFSLHLCISCLTFSHMARERFTISRGPLHGLPVCRQLGLGGRQGGRLGTLGFLNLDVFPRTKDLPHKHKVAQHSLCLSFLLTLASFHMVSAGAATAAFLSCCALVLNWSRSAPSSPLEWSVFISGPGQGRGSYPKLHSALSWVCKCMHVCAFAGIVCVAGATPTQT